MEDNNVNNIQNNENEISTQSTISSAEGNLDFSLSTDEIGGTGGGSSSSSSSSSSGSITGSGTSQTSSSDLTPILLILSDSTDTPTGDEEEPVLLEEDDSQLYTIEQNTSQTGIYTINVGSDSNTCYTDEEHVIAILDSNNNIVNNENNDGNVKITAKIDQTWCTVSFVHPLNSPFQQGKYNLNSTNFSHDNDIKVVVPMIHCDSNIGNQRTANITFQIQNLDTDLKMQVIQDAKNEDGPYKYTIFMLIVIDISRKIDAVGNTLGTVIQTQGIDSISITYDNYTNTISPTEKYNTSYDQYNNRYNYVVSRLMYAYDIELSQKLTDDNNVLKQFIDNLDKSMCLTEVGGNSNIFNNQEQLSTYSKNIYDILGNANDNNVLYMYLGDNWQENTYWELLNSQLNTTGRYNPFNNLGTFIGNSNNTLTTSVTKITNITQDDLHLIIYNQTLNEIVKDINWTNWTKKTNESGDYNIIARALWKENVSSMINANVSDGNLEMTIGLTATPSNDINVLYGNAGNYKISDLLFLIENNRLSINADGEQFIYLANANGLVHNSGYDFTDEYGDYYVIDVSDKITQNGTVVNLKDIDNFGNVTICLWFRVNSSNQPTLIGTIDLAGVWPNAEEAYIGFYD